MNRPLIAFAITLLLAPTAPRTVQAYGNVYAHPRINSVIVSEFLRRMPEYAATHPTFAKFSFYTFDMDRTLLPGMMVAEPGNLVIQEREGAKTPLDWLMHGGFSADEPELPAALRHFYDPARIVDGKTHLTDLGAPLDGANPQIDAIHWAFDGTDPAGNNRWTWEAGKTRMREALEGDDPIGFSRKLGEAFRCLGEVLHNTADMGCPPHVRNDAHGGFRGVGGADPYESLYKPDWTSVLGNKSADPENAAFFRSATLAREINTKLAEFTNRNFVSHETISGLGKKEYHALNGYPDYPAPKLQDLEYDPATYSYTKHFPSGRSVKMCVDQSFFLGFASLSSRGRPRVDSECVESQAAELIPNIVEAGINVIRAFIPELQLSVSGNADATGGTVEGSVTHVPDAEYPTAIAYTGRVEIWVNGGEKRFSIQALDGVFSAPVTGLRRGDRIAATVDLGGIEIDSEEVSIVWNDSGEVQDTQEFEYSWSKQTTTWPPFRVNWTISGRIRSYAGTTIVDPLRWDPSESSYGATAVLIVNLRGGSGRFDIQYNVSASFEQAEFERSSGEGHLYRREVCRASNVVLEHVAGGFGSEMVNLPPGGSVAYAPSSGNYSGSLYSNLFYDRKTETYDINGTLTSEDEAPHLRWGFGSSSLEVIIVPALAR